MKRALKEFEKAKDYLICVDSDGCVLDTMDVKHMRCFAPCLVHEWELNEYRDDIIRLWRKVNLLSYTRGINRFKGLGKVLAEINENYMRVEGLSEYVYWLQTTGDMSEESLAEAYEQTGSVCIKKALDWSRLVNQMMAMVPDSRKMLFEGAKEALKLAREHADVVIISGGNGAELLNQWRAQEIFEYADLFVSQEVASKRRCLQMLLDKGYEADHVIMVGDAQVDLDAANDTGVLFYPVLPYQERESWDVFSEAFEHFVNGTYAGKFQEEKIKAFQEDLENM